LFGSVQQIKLAIRQLLGAHKYSVSCGHIVSYHNHCVALPVTQQAVSGQ